MQAWATAPATDSKGSKMIERITNKRITACLAGLAFLGLSAGAGAQSYPTKSIRMIAPISPGGGADTAARLLARVLTDAMGQQVVIDNRPGGGSVLGTAIAAKATPDGYNILWVNSAHAINDAFARDVPYDSVKDFAPVALLAKMPLILIVHQSCPARSIAELLTAVRASPGKYNYASSGIGSGSYLALEMLKIAAKIDMVNVSYKGAAPSVAALFGGEVQMAMLGPLSVKPHLASGKVRALAVSTAKRSAAFPDIPALQESVPNYEMTNWYGVLAPRGTPPAAIERLNREVAAAQRDKSLVDALAAEGAELVPMTPAQFGEYLRLEVAKYRTLSKALKIQLR
jgi:tripartite-type tricarboxylate transporter receptor subunit TctC